MPRKTGHQLTVMVSSTVYGREALLDQVFAVLKSFGYKVWNSHKGTLPIIPGKGTYETCLAAVEQCDIFLAIITPEYGSGTDGAGGASITHRELDLAVKLDKPRFILAHEQVVLARRLLLDLQMGTAADRAKLKLKKGAAVIDDLRLIDMYEAGTREHIPIGDRTDNWVQKYRSDTDVLLYVGEQFERRDDLQRLVDAEKARREVAKAQKKGAA